MKRVLTGLMALLVLCLAVLPVSAAMVADYDLTGQLTALTEPTDGIVPLIYCRATDDLTADAATWQEGKTGQGALLDGRDAYFRSDAAELRRDAVTIALWVNWLDAEAAPAEQRLLSVRGGNRDTQNLTLIPADGADGLTLQMHYGQAQHRLTTGKALATGWHHVAVVWQADGLQLYVDGVAAAEAVGVVGPATFSARQMCLGKGMRTGENGYFHGLLDDVLFFEKALTADEVKALAGVATDDPAAGEDAPAPTDDPADVPVEEEKTPADPLQKQNYWWLLLLLIPVAAVAVILLTLRPWNRRNKRNGRLRLR